MEEKNINRFIKAQKQYYEEAFYEIKQGKKTSHWMWYIFPQIHGLGKSNTAKYYEIQSIKESIEYINNNHLYNNLINICKELLKLSISDPIEIFGITDAMKLKSSMTLFNYILQPEFNNVLQFRNYVINEKIQDVRETEIFRKILEKYYKYESDLKTIEIIESEMFVYGMAQEHINRMQGRERKVAENLLLKYSEIAPIAIDMLGEFDGVNVENKGKRELWYRSLTEKEFKIFSEFKELGIIEIAEEIRKKYEK